MILWGKNKCCTKINAQKYGSFKRKSDGEIIQRFLCKKCKSTFSLATNDLAYGQKKRFINDECHKLLTDNVSIRNCAKYLNVSTTTILRKAAFLKKQGLI